MKSQDLDIVQFRIDRLLFALLYCLPYASFGERRERISGRGGIA